MSDGKYFQRGKVQELRQELANADKKDTKLTKRRNVLKRIVANMTIGNDMSPLFSDVIACITIRSLEVKKMVYLYVINYARHKPDLTVLAIDKFLRDTEDPNPLIRALALRTISYINVQEVVESVCKPLHKALADRDPYVCKTAALCVPKLFSIHPQIVVREGFIPQLRQLLSHQNSMVVSNAIMGLTEISEKSRKNELQLNFSLANSLLSALDECTEWGQAYILGSLIYTVPQTHDDAELLADRIMPRLQHSNSAIVLTTVRVLVFLTSYIENNSVVDGIFSKLGAPLITVLNGPPEIQFLGLRNILILIQRDPSFLRDKYLNVFFCKYNDPIYVKMAKLQILHRLAAPGNIHKVLPELKEYAQEVDVTFVRKSVRAIGRCAIKIDVAADMCVDVLVELIRTKINYIVQEAIIVVKDIFRRYSNKYENVISILCENLESLDEPEAKASLIWIIGQFSDRIENAAELLNQFWESQAQDPSEVQLALLTAIVKLFIRRPSAGQDLLPKVLKFATEETDDPDLRDRGFIYWRLLTVNPVAAKNIILATKPAISIENDAPHRALLDILLLNISTLSSIYRKPPSRILSGSLDTRFVRSPAFVYRDYGSNGILSSGKAPQDGQGESGQDNEDVNNFENSNNIGDMDIRNSGNRNGYNEDFPLDTLRGPAGGYISSSAEELAGIDLLGINDNSDASAGIMDRNNQGQSSTGYYGGASDISGITHGIQGLDLNSGTSQYQQTQQQQSAYGATMAAGMAGGMAGGMSGGLSSTANGGTTAYDKLLEQQRQQTNISSGLGDVSNGSIQQQLSLNQSYGVNPFARALQEQQAQQSQQQQQQQQLPGQQQGMAAQPIGDTEARIASYLAESSGKPVVLDPFASTTIGGNPFAKTTSPTQTNELPLAAHHPDAPVPLTNADFLISKLVPTDDQSLTYLPTLLTPATAGATGLQIQGEIRLRKKHTRQEVLAALPPELQQMLLATGAAATALLDYELVLVVTNGGISQTQTQFSILFNRNPLGVQPLSPAAGVSMMSALAANPKQPVQGLVPGGKTIITTPLYLLPQARLLGPDGNPVQDNTNILQAAVKVDAGLAFFHLKLPL